MSEKKRKKSSQIGFHQWEDNKIMPLRHCGILNIDHYINYFNLLCVYKKTGGRKTSNIYVNCFT